VEVSLTLHPTARQEKSLSLQKDGEDRVKMASIKLSIFSDVLQMIGVFLWIMIISVLLMAAIIPKTRKGKVALRYFEWEEECRESRKG
jgi:hypothetical protein